MDSDNNEENATCGNSADDMSTNMNSVSLANAEIYIGDKFEWKGNVYEIKKIDQNNGTMSWCISGEDIDSDTMVMKKKHSI